MISTANDLSNNVPMYKRVTPFQQWSVFFAMCIAIFALVYNTMATTNAMIAIRDQMSLNASQLQWTMNGYILPAASLTVLLGMMSDHFGKRNIFVIMLLFFIVGSLLASIATTPILFIIGRVLQGAGAACMMPVSLAILKIVFPPERQDLVTTSWSIAVAASMMLGPFLSGYIVPHLGWPFVFWISFILGVATLVILVIAAHKHVPGNASVQFDFVGMIVFLAGIILFVFAFVESGTKGWGSSEMISMLVIGFLLLLSQPFVERFVKKTPFIDYNYFKDRDFAMGCIGFFIEGYVLLCVFFFFNIVSQNHLLLDFSTTTSGNALLPFGFSLLVATIFATRIIANFGKLFASCLMMGLFVIGFLWFVIAGANVGYDLYWEPLVLIGLGAGLGMKFVSFLAVSDFEADKVARASSIASCHFYIGAIFGTSLGVILYLIAVPGLVSTLATHYQIHGVSMKILQNAILGHSSAIKSIVAMGGNKTAIEQTIRQACSDGFVYMAIGSLALSVIGFICSWIFLDRKSKQSK